MRIRKIKNRIREKFIYSNDALYTQVQLALSKFVERDELYGDGFNIIIGTLLRSYEPTFVDKNDLVLSFQSPIVISTDSQEVETSYNICTMLYKNNPGYGSGTRYTAEVFVRDGSYNEVTDIYHFIDDIIDIEDLQHNSYSYDSEYLKSSIIQFFNVNKDLIYN